MSRIYFHSESQTLEVSGSERAWMGELVRRMAAGIFDMLSWETKLRLMPESYAGIDKRDRYGIANRVDDHFETSLGGLMGDRCFTDGEVVFDAVLNTVLLAGSEPMRFAARCHAQCEIHGFVEAQDAPWLASVIEEAIACGVLRKKLRVKARDSDEVKEYDQGWDAVVEMLKTTSEPVVTSYSVCESFPNSYVADWETPVCEACGGDGQPNNKMMHQDIAYDHCTSCGGEGRLQDAWYDLTHEERWELGLRGLRGLSVPPRWYPQTDLDTLRLFGSGKSAFDYLTAPDG